tara:strand:+ start:229 stop:405 length:177 start_codon:yes stop_codon:yes gene_type:complete
MFAWIAVSRTIPCGVRFARIATKATTKKFEKLSELGLWGLDPIADNCIIEAYKTTTNN